MKTYLFAGGFRLVRAILLTCFMFLINVLSYAQDKVYASSQTNSTSGICLLCSVDNPQNAVGNNEDDFSTLYIPIGLVSSVQQTLIFPASTLSKVVIGIGSSNAPLSINLLGAVTVESFLGNTPNNDAKTIENTTLKIGQDQHRATVEFQPTKAYDRIKIKTIAALDILGSDLRIYYAYYKVNLFPICNEPPFESNYYFPFNGNTKDTLSDLELIGSPTYKDSQVCGKAITRSPEGTVPTLASRVLQYEPGSDGKTTISFWARAESGESIDMKVFGLNILVTGGLFSVGGQYGYAHAATIPGQLNHYTVTYSYVSKQPACIYINGIAPSGPGDIPCIPFAPEPEDITDEIDRLITVYPAASLLDELVIYKKWLTADNIRELACSYNILPSCPVPVSLSNPTTMKVSSAEETFTVSPNPTSGQITISGNILFPDAEISIRNISGTEVYRSKFSSKTFELPTHIPGGTYMLTVQTKDKKTYTRKIILSR